MSPTAPGPREFWRSSGMHLTRRNAVGWLEVTPELLRAWVARPELQPVETSCPEENRLYDELLENPRLAVPAGRLSALQDREAVDNYCMFLGFRDRLVAAGTVEAAYLDLVRPLAGGKPSLTPPLFIEQLAHLILRNALDPVTDPMRLRAAELFFREQRVSTDGGRVMLADAEIVDRHARADPAATTLGGLLQQTATPMRQVTLDVLDDDNREIYWDRSDRFDTVIDYRFGEPAPDALCRVMETWLRHLVGIDVHIEPRPKLEDADWRWHIGLDLDASRILDDLYKGKAPPPEQIRQIIGLFRMRFRDENRMIERVRGRPIYLGLAMTAGGRLRMKPQNLLMNLPLRADS